MTLTLKTDPDMVKGNQRAKYVGQRSFHSKVTHCPDAQTDEAVGKGMFPAHELYWTDLQ